MHPFRVSICVLANRNSIYNRNSICRILAKARSLRDWGVTGQDMKFAGDVGTRWCIRPIHRSRRHGILNGEKGRPIATSGRMRQQCYRLPAIKLGAWCSFPKRPRLKCHSVPRNLACTWLPTASNVIVSLAKRTVWLIVGEENIGGSESCAQECRCPAYGTNRIKQNSPSMNVGFVSGRGTTDLHQECLSVLAIASTRCRDQQRLKVRVVQW